MLGHYNAPVHTYAGASEIGRGSGHNRTAGPLARWACRWPVENQKWETTRTGWYLVWALVSLLDRARSLAEYFYDFKFSFLGLKVRPVICDRALLCVLFQGYDNHKQKRS